MKENKMQHHFKEDIQMFEQVNEVLEKFVFWVHAAVVRVPPLL